METKEEMKTRLILSLALVFILSAPACAEDVVIAEIDGAIDAGAESYVSRVLAEADSSGAKLILIKINSNTGFIKPAEAIVGKILDSKITVAGYSHKEFGGAFSCSAYILMASDIAVVKEKSGFGAAQPLFLDNMSLEERADYMEALAQINHRNRTLAREMVTENKYVDGFSAVEQNVAQYASGTSEELYSMIGLTGATTKTIEPDMVDRVFSFLSNPQLIALVFMLACFTAVYSFRTRNLISASASILLFLITFWGFSNMRFSMIGSFLMVLGIILVSLEMLHSRPTILCIAGGLCVVIGLLVLSAEPFHKVGGDTNILAVIFSVLLMVAAVYVGNNMGRSRAESRHSLAEGLVGKKARVIEELRRNGLVKVDGKVWPAYSIVEEKIPVDTVVEIVKLEGKVLTVVREGGPRTLHDHKHGSHGGTHGHGGHGHDEEKANVHGEGKNGGHH